ncbi:MAG TPA: ribose-phosphate diphosphokinase [Fimbriimonadaceae bacterium]|nr:ribose-phosphate diphosphokinase [Fimbriimonadaceae bacterium]
MSTIVKVFATTGTDSLAQAIFREIKARMAMVDGYCVEYGKASVSRFSNENIEVQVDNVRDHAVLVLHTQTAPVNDNLIQLFALLDAINNSHPRRTYVVFPYMPYSRSDRKNRPRISVMGQRLPEILNNVLGVRRVLLLEPHSQHLKQYFTPTADEVPAVPLLVNDIRANHLKRWTKEECVLVFADAGAAKRFEEVPSVLGLEQAYIHKSRPDNDERPAVKGITGNVKGRHCFIVDDEILTGNTLVKDAELLKSNGAASIHMFAVHGVLADRKVSQAELMKRLTDSPVDEIVVTDTVPIGNKASLGGSKFRVIEIAPLLGEACKRMVLGESLSELHKFETVDGL